MKKNCIQRVQAFLLALVLICSLAVPVAMAEGEISLNYTAAAMEIGDTLTLTADVADMLASAGISWKSNNPAVAAVQGSGAACTVTAEAPGAATITASITTGSCEPRGNLNGCHAKHRGKKRHTAAGSCGLSN